MRVIFNEEMKAVADDLDHMAQNVRKAIRGAGEALLGTNVEAAQAVIDGDAELDALQESVVDQCVKLLAKQNPVATDLRVVVSTMRLAITFERMGDLAKHVAEASRRAYPASPLPEEAKNAFTQMQEFLDETSDNMVAMLADRDAKTAERVILDDDNLRIGARRQCGDDPPADHRHRAAGPLPRTSRRPCRFRSTTGGVHRLRLRSVQKPRPG